LRKRLLSFTLMAVSDVELLEKASSDRRSLTLLLERHGTFVRPLIARKIPRRWRSLLTVDDVMQETYTEAALNLGDFQPRGKDSFQSWLITLATNNLRDAIDALEAEKRGGRWRRLEPRTSDGSYAALHEIVAGSLTTPSGKVARHEARSALDQAINQLPETYRMVVQRYDLDGRSIREVSTILDRTPGATFMLRARAHRLLGQLMGSKSKFFSSGSC